MGFFNRLKEGLSKTRNTIAERIDQVLVSFGKVDEDLLEELEEVLIMADMGIKTVNQIMKALRQTIKERKITDPKEIKTALKEEILNIFSSEASSLPLDTSPVVILVVGVNGVGKTTSIGKLAHRYKNQGKRVLVAAADTFRAAAIDQLQFWADRTGVELVKHIEGADPAAVVYDAAVAAKSRKADVLICDTAGRLHTKKNLMEELKKINRVIDRELPSVKKETLLVLDATTGQNAVSQAKTFKETVDIQGMILTKLDGTAKGGIVIAIQSELNVPVKFIGIGEKVEDLQDFLPQEFVEAVLG